MVLEKLGRLGADPWVLNVVKTGYSIKFWHPPLLSMVSTMQSGSLNPLIDALMETEFHKLLKKGAIEIPEDNSLPGFYSRLFLVPKPNNKWRPVIDLSHLNDFVQIPRFKMETPQKVMSSLKKGCWVYSLDLKDAYLQVPIHQRSRKYLCMEFKGTICQFTSLPFGISTAPWLFTRVPEW